MKTEPSTITHLKFSPGTHIGRAAEMLVKSAPSRGEFNGVELVAQAGTAVDDLVARYDSEMSARALAWRTSPEGEAAEARTLAERQNAQRMVDEAMAALGGLNFENLGDVLAWWEGVADPLDVVGVTCDRTALVETFVRRGYAAGAFCNEEFVADDRNIYARWIVGQCLAGMVRVGAPHQVCSSFIAKWRAQFETSDRRAS